MRNMNVSIKLAMSFLILSIMTIITGVVGIGGMTRINSGSREMYESQSQPLADLGIAREYFQRLRVQLRDVVLASGNTLELDVIAAYLVNHEQGFIRYIEAYRRTITDPDMIALYDEIMAAFGEYQPSMQQIMASARVSAPPVQMLIMMNGLEEPTNFVMDALSYLAYVRVQQAAHVNDLNSFYFRVLFAVIVSVIAVSIAIALFLAKYVSDAITRLNEYERAQYEMRRLSADNAALERVNRLRAEMVQTISHEARTPLAVLSSYASLVALEMQEKNSDPKIAADLDKIAHEAKRVANLIDYMKSLPLRKDQAAQRTELDLGVLIGQTVRLYQHILERLGVSLVTDIPDSLPPAFGKADELTQIMFNLLQNAKNHTAQGDEIAIRLRNENDELRITVADTGSGITPELLPHVFEYGIGGGSGIGLAVCKEIVQAHGGSIAIESEAGKGTAVTFTLPCVQ